LPARVEPLRADPPIGEHMKGPVGREDDGAVPVVIPGRVRRALDAVAGVPGDDALARDAVGGRRPRGGAPPRVRGERAGDGGWLKIVDERLGRRLRMSDARPGEKEGRGKSDTDGRPGGHT